MDKKTILLIIFLIMNWADAIITLYALENTLFIESNPFYYLNPVLFWVVKIVIFPLGLILFFRRLKAMGFYILIAIYSIALVNNFIILIL